ncbi:hypothetical protein V5O48_007666 [Marasmius crinis-equi]|uniref:GH16 domain-containing protein n=1 Tax=Marasmius crinis-equi TaxID=585013 RepID=A0ABR3FGN0_9AGAR
MREFPIFLLSLVSNLNSQLAGYLKLPGVQIGSPSFTLQDDYRGQDFFNQFDFISRSDPTHGLVDYQSKQNAIAKGLAYVQNGVTVLAVDNKTVLPSGSNRASIRIESKKKYDSGLFIADFEAMPVGCSTWPAWWSRSVTDYPKGGEIDVIEGVNSQTFNDMTFWRKGGSCNFPPASLSGTTSSIIDQKKCSDTTTDLMSCGFRDGKANSFGTGFNKAGGGVYAHLVNDDGISIWHFPRKSIPKDIKNKKPDPSSWGKPVARWKSTKCDMKKHFRGHKLVINTTLCGSWAGDPGAWARSKCPRTCPETVADPKNFNGARWKIKYISVYKQV